MKQKLLALMTALALCFGLAGCNISTPATVGSLGDVEITSGIYLISQFQAYQTVLGYANSTQSSMSTSAFLKETVYVAEDGTMAPEPAEGETQTGEARSVSEFVASETLANLQYYAAVETLFAELGGKLTQDEMDYAAYYAEQLWAYYGETYEANGIGLTTLTAYQYTSLKNSALLELMYGTDGVEPVSDDALTAYLYDDLVYLKHISVPMYNTSDYTFADETQQAEILTALDALLTQAQASMTDDGMDAATAFESAVSANIGAAYDVMGSSYDVESLLASDIYTELLSEATLTESYDDETIANIMALETNEGLTFVETYTSAKAMLRLDPLESSTLEDLRYDILIEMKADALETYLDELGAGLANTLDTSGMKSLPASKVVSG